MRLLVTGGCGFIGSNFISLLLAEVPGMFICNADIMTYAANPANIPASAWSSPELYRFVQADIANCDAMTRLMREQRIDAVVNFAAETHVDRSIHDSGPFLRANVLGVESLLQAAHRAEVARFVQVSTDEVYGSLGPEGHFTEQSPLAPNSPYSASKASGDLLCRAWMETYGLPVVITRCSNNYGPRQFPEKLIPFMYHRAMENEPLPVYGDGLNVRDWIHVDDHCRGVFLALKKGKPGAVYNFGGDAERTNLEVVHEILAFCDKPESLIRLVTDRPGHDRRYAMDHALATAELGFSPQRGFAQGLKETLSWYAANQDWTAGVSSGAYRSFLHNWYGGRL